MAGNVLLIITSLIWRAASSLIDLQVYPPAADRDKVNPATPQDIMRDCERKLRQINGK
jgi:hypothetical protein